MFHCGASFLVFVLKSFTKCLPPRHLPCPEKFLVARLHSDITLFAKRPISNNWHCSEYMCLDNCSVVCTAILCYVLHQTHSEFWHIQRYFFRCMPAYLFNHTQRYWGILTHIDTLLRHIQACSDKFTTLCNPRIFTNLSYSEPWDI